MASGPPHWLARLRSSFAKEGRSTFTPGRVSSARSASLILGSLKRAPLPSSADVGEGGTADPRFCPARTCRDSHPVRQAHHSRSFRMSAHTIQRGDTLGALARKFNTTVDALAAANGIKNKDLIHTGAKLIVPGKQDDFGKKPE